MQTRRYHGVSVRLTDSNTDQRCCFNCEFFDVDDAEDLDDPEGMCRRHAPRAVLAYDEDGKPLHRFTLFPVVIASEWCGEFRVLNNQHGNETANNGRTADRSPGCGGRPG